MPFIMDDSHKQFCSSLLAIGVLKYGEFTTKNGRLTSYHIDLRLVMSHPALMNRVSAAITHTISSKTLDFDCICGVPYVALPLSTLISVHLNKPMVLRRKEPKSYGTKLLIEGKYNRGDSCIIIDDVIGEGTGIRETISDIESVGMIVKDVIVVVDREEGGVQKLSARGYNVHSLYTITQITHILKEENQIDQKFVRHLEAEKTSLQISDKASTINQVRGSVSLFEERMERAKSVAAVRLFSLMSKKQTNLCVAADVSDMNKLLTLANEVGPHICVLKIRLTLLETYPEKQIEELKAIANHHQFLIMEDRKLCDTGNAVRLQFNQISKCATLITAHSVSGFGLLEAIKTSDRYSSDFGIFLIAELKNENNLISADYIKKTLTLAKNYRELVAGVISHSQILLDASMIQISPQATGLSNKTLSHQHCSSTSDEITQFTAADIMVVGKPIICAPKPATAAKEFRVNLWNKYLQRVQS